MTLLEGVPVALLFEVAAFRNPVSQHELVFFRDMLFSPKKVKMISSRSITN